MTLNVSCELSMRGIAASVCRPVSVPCILSIQDGSHGFVEHTISWAFNVLMNQYYMDRLSRIFNWPPLL